MKAIIALTLFAIVAIVYSQILDASDLISANLLGASRFVPTKKGLGGNFFGLSPLNFGQLNFGQLGRPFLGGFSSKKGFGTLSPFGLGVGFNKGFGQRSSSFFSAVEPFSTASAFYY